ncbi:MAG: hypothetical protein NTNFB02_01490 [Nitrospira sp.]
MLSFNPDEMSRLLFEATESLIFSESIPELTGGSLLTNMILALRPIRHQLPRAELIQEMREGCNDTANRICNGGIDEVSEQIQATLWESRVLCVSELHDNVVMWSHYAEEHRGVAFKLRCIDEIDNALLAARPMLYSHSFLPFPDVETYVKHLTGEQPLNWGDLCQNLSLIKHVDWGYEKEWRVHLHKGSRDGFDVYPENPQVFEAIYLGCRMDDNRVGEIVKLVRQHLPGTKLLRGVKSSTQFALSFAEIPQD